MNAREYMQRMAHDASIEDLQGLRDNVVQALAWLDEKLGDARQCGACPVCGVPCENSQARAMEPSALPDACGYIDDERELLAELAELPPEEP